MLVYCTLGYSYSFEKCIKLAEKITEGTETLKSTSIALKYMCVHKHVYTYTLNLKNAYLL